MWTVIYQTERSKTGIYARLLIGIILDDFFNEWFVNPWSKPSPKYTWFTSIYTWSSLLGGWNCSIWIGWMFKLDHWCQLFFRWAEQLAWCLRRDLDFVKGSKCLNFLKFVNLIGQREIMWCVSLMTHTVYSIMEHLYDVIRKSVTGLDPNKSIILQNF